MSLVTVNGAAKIEPIRFRPRGLRKTARRITTKDDTNIDFFLTGRII